MRRSTDNVQSFLNYRITHALTDKSYRSRVGCGANSVFRLAINAKLGNDRPATAVLMPGLRMQFSRDRLQLFAPLSLEPLSQYRVLVDPLRHFPR